jgi:hypothetical protein
MLRSGRGSCVTGGIVKKMGKMKRKKRSKDGWEKEVQRGESVCGVGL